MGLGMFGQNCDHDLISREKLLGNPEIIIQTQWGDAISISDIEQLDSEDASYVRHGAWEPVNPRGVLSRIFRCTAEACGSYVDMGCYTRNCDFDYCPYCGALMDGVLFEDEKD